VIEPALDKGTWVVADRFLDSTTVYQGVGRGLNVDAVKEINSFAVGETMPDLTILLDLDVKTGHSRAVAASGSVEDRMESNPMEFFEKIREGYLRLAAEAPERFAVIDASATIDEVTTEIESVFNKRVGVSMG
jgi:dTMP kinase